MVSEARAPGASTAAIDRVTPHHARYDLVIVGGGSAGLPAAQTAAVLGARVALVDRERLGGDCLYTGCVPSKALLRVARAAHEVRHAGALGLDARLGPVDLAAVMDRVNRVIARVGERDAPEAYERLGVEVIFGTAQFTAPRVLSVNDHPIRAGAFLICTGSRPRMPDLPGLAGAGVRTSDTVWDLLELPGTIAIVGGGPVGVELAQAFARLGSRVTLLQRGGRILPREDPEASTALHACLAADGVDIRTGADVRAVALRGGQRVVTASAADGTSIEVAADEVLLAVGRVPYVEGLGLAAAGVALTAEGAIQTDATLRTTNRRVYAAGDVRGAPFFTHAAARQARLAVRNAVLPVRARLDERALPWATFTDPEVARVGLSEMEARARYGERVRVYMVSLAEMDRAEAEGAPAGFVKLVAARDGELLGAQLVGRDAGEYINEIALALHARLKIGTLWQTTHVYPTLALAIQLAAGQQTIASVSGNPVIGALRRARRLVP
ncbi:MAG TPA: FAD-dependent oxidoreductase [Ktedonobacterales bacterium]|jgi:pyruvate/2-oxoglutarate dehydrogenase complex dihydrolipoamide dehydrogenase (E3) component